LMCLRHEWRAQGATHEYWEATDGEPTVERLGSLWIEDLGDGGSKSNKYARDITLLRQSLAQTPADPRTTFYLAQSYFDVGQFSEASRWYARRIKLGGWEEEVWYARYKRALCALKAGDVPSATALLLEAFDARPTRAEPLKVLAQVQREQGRHQSAFMFAVRGLEIPFPEGDALFVERGVYQWQLWEEIMISAYYVGSQYREMGMSACERLAALRGQEPWFYNYVARNQAYYLDDLDALRRGVWPLPEDLAASADASAASASAVNRPQTLSDVAADDPSTVLWSRADGSCVPVPLPGRTDRWLMLIYEQLSLDSGSIYSHRWLEISSEGGLLRHSRPFRFHHNGTERATRLWSADAERLCVTYECESGEIRWLELSWTTVLASLREAESQRLSGPRLTP
jgi:tetratricopeptide (TPR) repeat protein